MEVIILQGIPGSGKTTWAREFIKDKPKNWVIVSRDSIRNSLGEYWVEEREPLVTQIEKFEIVTALDNNFNVIVDATNLSKNTLNTLKDIVKSQSPDNTITLKFFDTDLETCILRDSLRQNPVGKDVIKRFYKKYIENKDDNTFTDTRYIALQDRDLPPCIICDIDGTLALMNGRNPYDDEQCINDKLNYYVNDILYDYLAKGFSIILLSGRQEKAREVTEKWLRKHLIKYKSLHMRASGDTRKDSIVKKELYEKHIKNKYYVSFWLDDRNQVVDMVRKELGLLCLQVYYGDF